MESHEADKTVLSGQEPRVVCGHGALYEKVDTIEFWGYAPTHTASGGNGEANAGFSWLRYQTV